MTQYPPNQAPAQVSDGINVLKALEAVQDAHAYLLGNPTDGASKAMGRLRDAAMALHTEIQLRGAA